MEHLWMHTAIILAIVVVSKLAASKTNTVDVLWLIILGAIGVNIGILPEHSEVLEVIGEWGIVFVMFALGFEENVTNFVKGLKKSWGIATIGAIFPFMAGYFSATLFGYSGGTALVFGLTMTATAVSLTMVSLKAENLHKSTAATGIMTAAIIDDILSLIGLAILIPLLLSSSSDGINADFGTIAIILLKVVIFFVIIIFAGTVLFPEALKYDKRRKYSLFFKAMLSIRKLFGIRQLLVVYKGQLTPLIMIFTAMLFGAIAHALGFHAAVGAYFAGLFLKEEYFTYKIEDKTHTHLHDAEFVINHLAFTIFGPIFFVMLGTKLIFNAEIMIKVLPMSLVLFGLVLVLQVFSAGLAARFTGGYKWHESVMIGLGMLGRAELAFIVINIAYTQNHIINLEEFYSLILTVFMLNLTVPVAIKWWKPYYNGDKTMKIAGITLSKE